MESNLEQKFDPIPNANFPERVIPQLPLTQNETEKPKRNKFIKMTVLIISILTIFGIIGYFTNKNNFIVKTPYPSITTTKPLSSTPVETETPSIIPTSSTKPADPSTKKLAVIFIRYGSDNRPLDQDFANREIFTNSTSLSAFYKEVSYGRLILTGKIFGPYTLPPTDDVCNRINLKNKVNNILLGEGSNPDDFDYIAYFFNGITTCSDREGWADIPGKESFYYDNNINIAALAHELGHNFGLNHASSYECTDAQGAKVAISNNCSRNEYGDGFDIMGSQLRHLNGYHKLQLGWVDPVHLQTITKNGTYTINPLEINPTGINILRILKKNNFYAGGKYNQYYYLEYRQPIGFDNFDPESSVVNGILIHEAPDYTYRDNSYLVKASQPDSLDSHDALEKGQVFEDANIGITITPISFTNNKATVSIKFD